MGPEGATSQDLEQPPASDTVASSHQQFERRHFPTDSMVTVRLSESSIPPLTEARESPGCNPFLDSAGTVEPSDGKKGRNNMQHEELSSGKIAVLRESVASSLSSIAEEQQTGNSLSDVRSGSKSRSSFSSISSAQFDWDELDKSEEQVLREDESDEVCGQRDTL